jgi:intracellular sulfur oxidation DsrE/DsrF family protein
MSKAQIFKDVCVGLFFITAAGFVGVTAYEARRLSAYAEMETRTMVGLVKERDEQLKGILKSVGELVNETHYDNRASAETVTVILRDVAELVRETRQVLPEVVVTIREAKVLMASINEDAAALSGAGVQSMQSVQTMLAAAETAVEGLDVEVKAGGKVTRKAVEDLDKALLSLDLVLADPNITATLGHVRQSSENLAESTKSVDIALRPLREKAKLLKIILLRALGMIRINPF